jgi:hypothetical protein
LDPAKTTNIPQKDEENKKEEKEQDEEKKKKEKECDFIDLFANACLKKTCLIIIS